MKFFLKKLFILSVIFVFFGLMAQGDAQTEGEPIVNFAYAPERIRQGDTLKIYLSITDPEGNMHRVAFRIEQPGETYYKPDFIYLKKGMEKQFTGHFVLYTRTFVELDDFVLALSILDRAGNVRKEFRFPLNFDETGEPMKPLPPDMEKDLNRRIGIIEMDWSLGGNMG
jgi:hypothetical protein